MPELQADQDYLLPETVPVTSCYCSRSLSARGAFADDVVLRVTVSPSFFDDYVIGMRDAGRSGSSGHTLFYLRDFLRQRQRHPKLLPQEDCNRPLTKATAQLVSAAWIRMLREARHPRHPRLGLDGTTYQFYAETPEGGLAGRTWSPEPDSNPRRLVELAEAMARYCNGELEEADIATKSAALCEKLARDA